MEVSEFDAMDGQLCKWFKETENNIIILQATIIT